MARVLLTLGSLWICSCQPAINIAGSSTVFPVANAWAANINGFQITIEGGGSSSGARRVCAPHSHPTHVDIGDMSRDWKSSEALLLDDGYTFECKGSKLRVTQIQVGVDGLAVVVAKNSRAHDCLTNPNVGGVTLAMLHWIFTDWNNTQLSNDGVDLASTIPNDDGDGIKEWSDLSSACPEVPINAYGPGSQSGTFDFFAEATLCKNCFGKKDGYVPEDFNYCPTDALHTLEGLNGTGNINDYMTNTRPANCYMSSESDYQLVQWLLADTGGIAYFGYSYYISNADLLTVVRVASDRILGVVDTADAKVEPSIYTITDGSYSVYKRQLFMNVDNTAWDRVHPYLSYGFSEAGQSQVSEVGYVPVNAALLAKMKIRIEERGNEQADYVSVAPDECPQGTELSAVPYVNEFGTSKVNYTCTLCPLGKYKFLTTPTECSSCDAGKYTDQMGLSECKFCDPGYEVQGTSCRACRPGSYKKEVAAETCSVCDPGTFSNMSAQSDCMFCPQGYFSPENSTECFACPLNEVAPLPRTGQCSPCGAGFSTRSIASTSCFRCKVGTYRSDEVQCVTCPGKKTTAYQGAATVDECVCPAETYLSDGLRDEQNHHLPSGTCLDCGEGLVCELGSDMRNFEDFMQKIQTENTENEDKIYPLVQAGYFARPGQLTEIFKCGNPGDCPGGLPGSCASGRTGALCGHCEAGSKTTADGCESCGFMDFFLFCLAFMLMLAGVPFFYYFMNSPMTSKASTLLSTAIAFGMTMTLLQTVGLVGIVKMKWPPYMQPLMDFASVFMLDLGALSFSCWGLKPYMSYIFSVFLWPGALLWLFICAVVSRFLPPRFHFEKAKALSTGGQIFQIGFTVMSKTALLPFMCYSHPNGKSSVLELSDVICWESEQHIIMVIFGVCMTAVMCCYWCFLLFLTRVAPIKSQEASDSFFKSSRFLFFRFRPDFWWYGTWFILRGPLLAIPMTVFTNFPHVQLFAMTAVLEVYMVIQLVVWPWKTPLINLADGAMSMMLILLLSVASAFLDALEGDVRATYSVLAGVILAGLYSVTFLLLCMVLAAFCHRATMGSQEELAVLTLGKPPKTMALISGLQALSKAFEEADLSFLVQTIDEFNVYDRRMLANVLTTMAPYFDNDARMRLLHQMRLSTVSLSTYASERNSRSTRSTFNAGDSDETTDTALQQVENFHSNLAVKDRQDKEYREDSSSDPASPTFLEATNRAHFAEALRSMDI